MSSTKSQGDFDEALNTIQSEFLDGGKGGESNTEIANALLDQVLKRERARRGVDRNPERWAEVDADTIKKMKDWNTRNPKLVISEKAFRELATDQGAEAVKLIDDDVEGRKKAISTKQSKVASKPRRKNPIAIRIEEIVAGTPKISKNSLMHTLKKEVGGDVIESETDDEFMPRDRKFRGIKKSGLRNHLLRAKK
jgi:hypothetical protein